MTSTGKDGSALVRLVREDLGGQVYARIAHAISENELRPGQRLVEDDLAAVLGVSRAPIRDALRALERDGLVESRPRRGKFVTSVSARDAAEVYSLRAALEGMACYLAAPNVADDQIEELIAITAEMRHYSRAGDVKMLTELDTKFHEKICLLSGNQRLIEDWRRMSRQIRLLSRRVIDTQYRDLDAVPGRHEYLARQLASHDRAAAEAAVREHIESVAINITAALRELEEREAASGARDLAQHGGE
jgi:DNA-binding GntR family transcriptional regulator